MTVRGIISVLAPPTQAGINPARDFGPRLVAYSAGCCPVAIPGPEGDFFMVYRVGPFRGGVVSALLFRLVFQRLMAGKRIICTSEPPEIQGN